MLKYLVIVSGNCYYRDELITIEQIHQDQCWRSGPFFSPAPSSWLRLQLPDPGSRFFKFLLHGSGSFKKAWLPGPGSRY